MSLSFSDQAWPVSEPAAICLLVLPRTQTFGVSGWRCCVRRSANARKYRDYSGDHKNRKYAAVSRGFVAGGPGFEPGLTESEFFIHIRLQSSSTTHRFGPTAERHGPADPEPFVLRGCDRVTHALTVVAKSACGMKVPLPVCAESSRKYVASHKRPSSH